MTDDPAGPNPYAAPAAEIVAGAPGARSQAGLRITAGVILILAAVVNLFAALGYAAGGAVVSGAVDLDSLAETPEDKQKVAELYGDVAAFRTRATSFMVFAGFLGLTVITSIAGAVSLFQGKRPRFIVVAAMLAAAAEIIAMAMSSLGLINVFGLVAALLAFVAAVSMIHRQAWSG